MGFTKSILNELNNRFPVFLEDTLATNPFKGEYFLPDVVGELLKEKKATVRVLKSPDKWYGVTYKEDKELVVSAIAELRKRDLSEETLGVTLPYPGGQTMTREQACAKIEEAISQMDYQERPLNITDMGTGISIHFCCGLQAE